MLIEEMEWKEDFGIGVEIIDNAHQEFFRIVRRLLTVTQQKAKNEWAAEQGVKFLKNYVLRHFQEEENYMRSIGYRDLPKHLAQHDIMRNKIVPRIEKHLAERGFSDEAMTIFLNILCVWITRHILGHDKAIAWAKASPASL